MIIAQCPYCTITSDMPVREDAEGILTVRCVYCGEEQTILFDTEPPLGYSEGTPSEGATNDQHQTSPPSPAG